MQLDPSLCGIPRQGRNRKKAKCVVDDNGPCCGKWQGYHNKFTIVGCQEPRIKWSYWSPFTTGSAISELVSDGFNISIWVGQQIWHSVVRSKHPRLKWIKTEDAHPTSTTCCNFAYLNPYYLGGISPLTTPFNTHHTRDSEAQQPHSDHVPMFSLTKNGAIFGYPLVI